MKIAIATDGEQVSAHFGRCRCYTIYDVDGETKKVMQKLSVDTPEHQPGMLPGFLNEKGVNLVIAGGMGPRAQNLFRDLNIEPIIGVSGKVEDALTMYLQGTLKPGASLCTHGSGEHQNCGGH